jgi:hypothetical protein
LAVYAMIFSDSGEKSLPEIPGISASRGREFAK